VLDGPTGKQTRFAKGGGSFASTIDRRLVFGLGTANEVGTLTVYWPWGGSQKFTGLKSDGYWRLVEGDATAHRVEAPKP
jgi:hypothetical protein